MFPEWLLRSLCGLGSMRGSRLTGRAMGLGVSAADRGLRAAGGADAAGGRGDGTSMTTSARGAASSGRSTRGCLDDLRGGHDRRACSSMHLDRLHRQPTRVGGVHRPLRASWASTTARLRDAATLTLPTPDGQFQARILGAVAKKESDDKSRRIRRKHEEIAASGSVSGGGSRPVRLRGRQGDGAPGGGGDRAECAKRLLAGEPVRSIARRPERARRAVRERRRSGRRRACAGCSPRRGSAASASTSGEIVATAEWPAIISVEDGATIRALLANPERRTNKAARRYLLGGLLGLQPLRRAAGRAPAHGRPAPLCLRERRRLLRLRQDLHQRRRGRAVRHRGGAAPARLARAAARDRAAAAQRARTRSAGWQEIEQAQAQLDELADRLRRAARSRWTS